jgi:MarR family 2-MHQ and catechol resistance regulon transcriptional repressor
MKPTMKTTLKYGQKEDAALSMWVKLARAYATFSRKSHESILSFGLTEPQFSVLETLGHLGSLSIGMLCKKQLVSGGNMTLVVDNLEKGELVRRIHSREDRRMIIVELTDKGTELFNKIFIEHAKNITQAASVLTDEEIENLSKILKKLGTSLNP